MGLSKGEETGVGAASMLDWLLPGIILLCALTLLLTGDWGHERLRFDRGGIAAGEVWRLLTGHLVHLGASHTYLNIAGLALVWFLVGRAYTLKQWLSVMAA